MLKLIVEDDLELCRTRVDESCLNAPKDGKYHPFIISGIACVADRVNRNARRYPYELLKREMDRYNNEVVKRKLGYGEFEHPDPDANMSDAAQRERTAIKILEITEDEKDHTWYARSQLCCSSPEHGIIGFPRADLCRTFYTFADGDTSIMGYSTRGYGELAPETDERFLKEGGKHVLSDYNAAALDIVMNPSSGVLADGIFESKTFMRDIHGQIVECALNDYEREINSSTKTFDLDKKREIYRAAFDTLLKKI